MKNHEEIDHQQHVLNMMMAMIGSNSFSHEVNSNSNNHHYNFQNSNSNNNYNNMLGTTPSTVLHVNDLLMMPMLSATNDQQPQPQQQIVQIHSPLASTACMWQEDDWHPENINRSYHGMQNNMQFLSEIGSRTKEHHIQGNYVSPSAAIPNLENNITTIPNKLHMQTNTHERTKHTRMSNLNIIDETNQTTIDYKKKRKKQKEFIPHASHDTHHFSSHEPSSPSNKNNSSNNNTTTTTDVSSSNNSNSIVKIYAFERPMLRQLKDFAENYFVLTPTCHSNQRQPSSAFYKEETMKCKERQQPPQQRRKRRPRMEGLNEMEPLVHSCSSSTTMSDSFFNSGNCIHMNDISRISSPDTVDGSNIKSLGQQQYCHMPSMQWINNNNFNNENPSMLLLDHVPQQQPLPCTHHTPELRSLSVSPSSQQSTDRCFNTETMSHVVQAFNQQTISHTFNGNQQQMSLGMTCSNTHQEQQQQGENIHLIHAALQLYLKLSQNANNNEY